MITDDQAAEMIEREQPAGQSSEPFLLPGVPYVLRLWFNMGPTVIEFGGLSPALADISGLMYPARSMWLKDQRATPDERTLIERFFRLLDREAYAIKQARLAEALDG